MALFFFLFFLFGYSFPRFFNFNVLLTLLYPFLSYLCNEVKIQIVMIIQVNYSRYGQSYKEDFTIEQARKELISFGYPSANTLTDDEVKVAIFEIFAE